MAIRSAEAIMATSISSRAWVSRILVLVGAAGAANACGSGTSTETDASTDAAGDAGDASLDAAVDVAADSPADAADAPTDSTSTDEIPTVRRPFLVGSTMRAATARADEDWSDALLPALGLDDHTRASLGRAWLEDALQEHASIAAFARFSMMMLAVSAPSELIAASQRASLDEIRHARTCFSLARRYGAKAYGPGTLRVDDTVPAMSLTELAVLTAEEGCVGETLGALLAEEQAARATDPVVASLLRRIARDEARHAELAWRFVTWAVKRGGADVARAVEQAVARASSATLAMEIRPLRVDAALWAAHGRLSCAEAHAVARRGVSELVMPAARALANQFSSAQPPMRPTTHTFVEGSHCTLKPLGSPHIA
jgi:hypothetical protein